MTETMMGEVIEYLAKALVDSPDDVKITETIDGVDDEDGCPEAGARSTVRLVDERVVLDAPARFARRSAALTPELQKQLRMIAQLIRSQMPIEAIVLEAYADRGGDGPLDRVFDPLYGVARRSRWR